MEIYTQQIKWLQDLNQEIRQRLSSMLSCTELETGRLEKLSEEQVRMVNDLRKTSSLIRQHLKIYEKELQSCLRKAQSKD
uniref:DNA polymerase n=1 Tax=uncultured marine virus TaxID=186617 RepID=A0A0F7L4L9_9VIRU|nr:DNA polymerase [uncultured marine virus]